MQVTSETVQHFADSRYSMLRGKGSTGKRRRRDPSSTGCLHHLSVGRFRKYDDSPFLNLVNKIKVPLGSKGVFAVNGELLGRPLGKSVGKDVTHSVMDGDSMLPNELNGGMTFAPRERDGQPFAINRVEKGAP